MPLILPNTIANEIPADGDRLEQNFDTIETFINQDVITSDGSTAMTAPLLLPGAPTQPNQAATKQYADDAVTANSTADKAYTDAQITATKSWAKNIGIHPGSTTVSPTDYVLNFGTSPLTGIAMVSASGFAGFSTANGTGRVWLFTSAYQPTFGGGIWSVGSPLITYTAGQWNDWGSISLSIPVTKGQTVTVSLRQAFGAGMTNSFFQASAVLLAVPGTWVAP